MRIFYLARHVGNIVPAIVGPERSNHCGTERQKESCIAGRDLAGAWGGAGHPEMPQASILIKERQNAHAQYKSNLQERYNRSDVTTDAHCSAIDQCGYC